jgi:hypothetical protein
MEAMWTRFNPVIRQINELVTGGIIGQVTSVQADFSIAPAYDPAHRLWNPDLAGGALLDLGIYPIASIRSSSARAASPFIAKTRSPSASPSPWMGTGTPSRRQKLPAACVQDSRNRRSCHWPRPRDHANTRIRASRVLGHLLPG